MSWLPLKLPPFCKIVVSCTREAENRALCQDYDMLTKMVDNRNNFLEVKPLGEELAYKVMKLWMESAGRDLKFNASHVVLALDGIHNRNTFFVLDPKCI